MTARISNLETSCTHEAKDNSFNQGQIKQRIAVYDTGMYCYLHKISCKIEILNFEYSSTGHSIFTSANM